MGCAASAPKGANTGNQGHHHRQQFFSHSSLKEDRNMGSKPSSSKKENVKKDNVNDNRSKSSKEDDTRNEDKAEDDEEYYGYDEEYYGYDTRVSNPEYEPTPPPDPPKSPPREPTPRETTPPPREPTPKEAIPPPREPTPKEATPPPRELTPKEATPPPREPTPKEKESSPIPPEPSILPQDTEKPATNKEPSEGAVDESFVEDDTPFDDDGVKDSEGYTKNMMGLYERTVDFRNSSKEDNDARPYGNPDKLYVDTEFPLDIAIVQDNDGIEWKRPKDFLDNPVLFTDGATRFDIGQGAAGTCWFLSTVANIAGDEQMVKQVIPDGSYRIEDSENYDGVFHARFYRFGKWEDVYIDDFLPVIYGNVLWGAKSDTDPNELWVALLEKAFARLYGSYDAVYGGQPGDAHLLLTGGIGERLELDDYAGNTQALFTRIDNASKSGCQISCVVPDEYHEVHGLVGGHAYSLVGVKEPQGHKLVRIRNPWGHGEWTGPWSDGSKEWSSIQDEVAAPNKDDGEFFVSLDDFCTYFSQTTVCALTPDFDCDGSSDSLNHILNIYGEWSGSSAAGFHNRLQNPKYCFTVTEEGMMENGTIPLVIQLIQQVEKRKTDKISIRCDVFRVLGDKISSNKRCIALEIQGTKNNVYAPELQSSFRHSLTPGSYIVVPSTVDEGQEKAFLLRLFTPAPLLKCRQISSDVDIVSMDFESSIDVGRISRQLTFEKTLFGAFVSGINAGGQVSHRESYHLNPQYQITIPEAGEDVPLVVHIMQTNAEPQYPVGFRLFKMDPGTKLPVDIVYLYDHYQDSPADMQGSQSKFMISWDVDTRYLLPPGRYIGLVHLDEPNTDKSFAIVFKSTAHVAIKGHQTG